MNSSHCSTPTAKPASSPTPTRKSLALPWRYGWLEWLGVEPSFKRSGIASRLLHQLTNLFIERDARIMLTDTDAKNHAALTFFRKNGFGQEMRHVYLSQNLEDHPKYIERRATVK
jgi:ribosomal protein S18 acetylase RimI-like enzyme